MDIAKLSKLKYLDISGCVGVISMLNTLIQSLPNLEVVYAIRSRVGALFDTLPSLDISSAFKSPIIIDDTLLSMANRLSTLKPLRKIITNLYNYDGHGLPLLYPLINQFYLYQNLFTFIVEECGADVNYQVLRQLPDPFVLSFPDEQTSGLGKMKVPSDFVLSRSTALHFAVYCATSLPYDSYTAFLIPYLLRREGIKVDPQDEQGKTPLMIACGSFRKQRKIVDLLIETGASVHIKDRKGWTPLFYSVAAGHDSRWSFGASRTTCLEDSLKDSEKCKNYKNAKNF
jgi:hypothetical protein